MAISYELPKSVCLHWFGDDGDKFHLIARISGRKDVEDLKQAVKIIDKAVPHIKKSDWDEGQDIEVYRLAGSEPGGRNDG